MSLKEAHTDRQAERLTVLSLQCYPYSTFNVGVGIFILPVKKVFLWDIFIISFILPIKKLFLWDIPLCHFLVFLLLSYLNLAHTLVASYGISQTEVICIGNLVLLSLDSFSTSPLCLNNFVLLLL